MHTITCRACSPDVTEQVCEGLPAGEYEIREAQPEDVNVRPFGVLTSPLSLQFLLTHRPEMSTKRNG